MDSHKALRNPQTFSISEFANLSRIPAVTLRAWERRYGLLNPTRNQNGHRLYSIEDLQQLQQIKHLLALGHNLSNIKAMLSEQPQQPFRGLDDWQTQLFAYIENAEFTQAQHWLAEISLLYPLESLSKALISPCVFHQLAEQQSSFLMWMRTLIFQNTVHFYHHCQKNRSQHGAFWVLTVEPIDPLVGLWCALDLIIKGIPCHTCFTAIPIEALCTSQLPTPSLVISETLDNKCNISCLHLALHQLKSAEGYLSISDDQFMQIEAFYESHLV